jgi:hypothetical protein
VNEGKVEDYQDVEMGIVTEIGKKKASLHDTMLRRHGRWRARSEAVLRGYF